MRSGVVIHGAIVIVIDCYCGKWLINLIWLASDKARKIDKTEKKSKERVGDKREGELGIEGNREREREKEIYRKDSEI